LILSNWLSDLTVIAIYLGFAGALGHSLKQFRTTRGKPTQFLWVSVSGLGFGMQTFALPFAHIIQIMMIALAAIIIILFGQRSYQLPTWIGGFRFGLRYMSWTMMLASIWSLTQLPWLLAISVGASAFLAGIFMLQRSLRNS